MVLLRCCVLTLSALTLTACSDWRSEARGTVMAELDLQTPARLSDLARVRLRDGQAVCGTVSAPEEGLQARAFVIWPSGTVQLASDYARLESPASTRAVATLSTAELEAERAALRQTLATYNTMRARDQALIETCGLDREA